MKLSVVLSSLHLTCLLATLGNQVRSNFYQVIYSPHATLSEKDVPKAHSLVSVNTTV